MATLDGVGAPALRYAAAALYVDLAGPYPELAAECWDVKRDATRYAGPLPVVAHPPCGPWSRMRAFSKGKGGGAELAVIAVEQVRRFGGVLEHPAESALWRFAGLPRPFELAEDAYGGRCVAIYQGTYGHVAPKLTWLYFVGVGPCPLRLGRGGESGRVVSQHSARRHLTPPDLARALCEWVAGGPASPRSGGAGPWACPLIPTSPTP